MNCCFGFVFVVLLKKDLTYLILPMLKNLKAFLLLLSPKEISDEPNLLGISIGTVSFCQVCLTMQVKSTAPPGKGVGI